MGEEKQLCLMPRWGDKMQEFSAKEPISSSSIPKRKRSLIPDIHFWRFDANGKLILKWPSKKHILRRDYDI